MDKMPLGELQSECEKQGSAIFGSESQLQTRSNTYARGGATDSRG